MKIAGQACCDSRWGKRLRLFLGVMTLFGCSPSATDLQNPVPSSEVERIYEPLVGKDGDLTVTSPNTVLNSYSTLGLGAMAGDKTITVTNILDLNDPLKGKPLGAGDLLLIYQAQGATIDTTDDPKKYGTVTAINGAGSFEFVTVESLSGNVITLGGSCGGLRHPYPSGGKAQVVRVPQFLNLTIESGASVVAKTWDGVSGGVVAIHVLNQTLLKGSIDVTAQGFRGGKAQNQLSMAGMGKVTLARTIDPLKGAEKGESIAGSADDYQVMFGGKYGRGAPANGGGGGNAHNGGGGGGGGGGDPLKWIGQGVMDGTVMGGALAWALDQAYKDNGNTFTTSTGGGRGGYTYSRPMSGVMPDPTMDAPGATKWGGDLRQDVGGIGGRPLDPVPGFQIFMGGGGGAGDEDNLSGGNGGNGGGVVLLMSGQVSVPGPGTGFIKASGGDGADTTNGHNDGAGGGGGGGSIFVFSNKTLSNDVRLISDGGYGGSQKRAPSDTSEADGPGGGGGGGFVAHTTIGTPMTSVLGQIGGNTVASTMIKFPSNGATKGNTGRVVVAARQPTSSGISGYYPLCLPADLQVLITPPSGQVQPNSNATFTVTISNKGDNPANGADITTTLPAGINPAQIPWTCNGTGGASCPMSSGSGVLPAQADLPAGGTLTFTVTVPVPSMSASPTLNLKVSAQPPPGYTDPTPMNNTASAMVPISGVVVMQPKSDLQVFVSKNPEMPAPGTETTITINAKNNGPDAAPKPVVVFSIPAGGVVTMAPPMPGDPSSPWGCVPMGTTYTCTLNQDLPANMTSLPIVVKFQTPSVGSGGPGTPQVPVVLGSPGSVDPNPLNNNAVVDVGPSRPPGTADLALTMTKSPAGAGPGMETTFTLQVRNQGPDAAQNPVVMVSVPAGSQLTQPAMGPGWSCTQGGTTVICITSAIASMTTASGIVVKLVAPTPADPSMSPGAVSGVVGSQSTFDPNPANNTASQPIAANPPRTGSDLSVRVTVDKPNPVPGDVVTYTGSAKNGGPDSVKDPLVTINLPPGVTVVMPAAGDGWSCAQVGNTVLCTRPQITQGEAPPITLQVKYPSSAGTFVPPTTVVIDAPTNNDPNPGNNTAVLDPRPTQPATNADLALTLTKTPPAASAGTEVTYTLQVTNRGPATVKTPSVTFTVPTGSTITQPALGTGWTCLQLGFRFTCYLGSDLSPSDAPPITVKVNTPLPADPNQDPGAVVGVVSSPSNNDPNLLNNSASVAVLPYSPTGSDLSVRITSTPQGPKPGDIVTYQADAKNEGPASVKNPVVTIELPPGSQLVEGPAGDGWSCALDANVVLCTRPSVPTGAAPPIVVKVRVPVQGSTETVPPGRAAVTAPANNDPVLDNNVATSQLYRFTGGGFACSLAGIGTTHRTTGTGVGWLLFGLCALLANRRRLRAALALR